LLLEASEITLFCAFILFKLLHIRWYQIWESLESDFIENDVSTNKEFGRIKGNVD